MSNLDFLTNEIEEAYIGTRRTDNDGNITVSVIFYGAAVSSWFSYDYTFDKNGNFLRKIDKGQYY